MSTPAEGKGAWQRITSAPTGRFTPWKFNWLANHKIIAALERVRPGALFLDSRTSPETVAVVRYAICT